MTRIQIFRVLFAAILGCSGCSPHEGRVVDADTDEPISDAFVVGQWAKNGWERTICFHIDMTKSDASGKFRIPALGIRNDSWFEDERLTLSAYKRGYRQQWYGVDGKFINPEKSGVIRLEKITEEAVTLDERIEILREEARQINCYSAGDSRNNVTGFYRALYGEALEYAGDRQTEGVLYLREEVEEYELGYEKAFERYQAGLRVLENIDKPKSIPEVTVIEHTDLTARGTVHASEK